MKQIEMQLLPADLKKMDQFITFNIGLPEIKQALYEILLDTYDYKLRTEESNSYFADNLSVLRGLLEVLSDFNEDAFDIKKRIKSTT